jgi:hypothetical protein
MSIVPGESLSIVSVVDNSRLLCAVILNILRTVEFFHCIASQMRAQQGLRRILAHNFEASVRSH